jgi:hypothetical protein
MNFYISNYMKDVNNKPQDLETLYEEIMTEGWWDRMKAHGRGAVGSLKGSVDSFGGKVKETAGKALHGASDKIASGLGIDPKYASKGKLAQKGKDLQKQGQATQKNSAQAGLKAKIGSYTNDAARAIVTDLKKLGIEVDNPEQLYKAIQDAIFLNVKSTNATGQFRVGEKSIRQPYQNNQS